MISHGPFPPRPASCVSCQGVARSEQKGPFRLCRRRSARRLSGSRLPPVLLQVPNPFPDDQSLCVGVEAGPPPIPRHGFELKGKIRILRGAAAAPIGTPAAIQSFLQNQCSKRSCCGGPLRSRSTVLTLYSAKSHKLNFLRSQAEQLDARLIAAWPRATKVEQRCFELLRRAYVDARYSPHYKISAEDLAWLGERVVALLGLVRVVCEDRLEVLRGGG